MARIDIELSKEDRIKIFDHAHGLHVFVFLEESGALSVSIGNREVDNIQIESREKLVSIKSPLGEPLSELISK